MTSGPLDFWTSSIGMYSKRKEKKKEKKTQRFGN
jgi:hypothetical protein